MKHLFEAILREVEHLKLSRFVPFFVAIFTMMLFPLHRTFKLQHCAIRNYKKCSCSCLTTSYGQVVHYSVTSLSAVAHKGRATSSFQYKQQKRVEEDKKLTKVSKSKKSRSIIDDDDHFMSKKRIQLRQNLSSGVVIERLGDRLLIEYPLDTPPFERKKLVCMQRGQFSASQEHIVPGDIVYFRSTATPAEMKDMASNNASVLPLDGIVEDLHPRKNTLQRPSAGSTRNKVTIKPIASNIDQLLVVVAIEPLVPLHTLDRYIVSAYVHDIPEVHFILNKADLPETKDLYELLKHYEKLGHKLILASAQPEPKENSDSNSTSGLTAVREILKGKTSVVVGQSGVGKSSLINALIPQASLRVGDLVANNMYGAHTTSNARMYHIPAPDATKLGSSDPVESRKEGKEDGNEDQAQEGDSEFPAISDDNSWGRIVDSPGIRELGIWHLDRRTIQEGFREITAHAQNCKFRDCAHEEKDAKFCAVWSALQDGDIHPARYSHFIALRDQYHD